MQAITMSAVTIIIFYMPTGSNTITECTNIHDKWDKISLKK